ACPLSAGAGPRSSWRPDEKRAVSVSFLAAAGDGGANAGLGLSAFRHHGKGGRVPAGAAVARTGRDERMAVACRISRTDHVHSGRLSRALPAGPERASRLLDDQPS